MAHMLVYTLQSLYMYKRYTPIIHIRMLGGFSG